MADSSPPHAFITGGAKRVGRAIALRLAKNGYDITLHYRHSYDEACSLRHEIHALGMQCRIVQGDLSDPHVAGALFTVAQNAYPMQPVTLLIHNASLFERDTLESVTTKSLDAHMQVNLTSPVMLTQAFVAQLPSAMHGHVIALVDGMRGWSLSPAFLSYSLSKLALEQFVTLTATHLAPRIRINSIALGATLVGHMDDTQTFTKTATIVPLNNSV